MRPVLFSFSHYDVRSAPFFAGLSILAAYLYFRTRREELGFSPETFWGLMAALMFGVFLGGPLLYVLLYGPGPAANLARTWSRGLQGGSFFGVFFGAAVAAAIWCRWSGRGFAPVADVLAASGLLGLGVMRVGCLLNGCCFGAPTGGSWGVMLPGQGVALHPVQLYEAAGDLAIFAVLHSLALPRVRTGRLRPGSPFLIGAMLYGGLRFGLDFLRGGDPGLLAFAGLSTAQWLGVGIAAAGLWLLRRGGAA